MPIPSTGSVQINDGNLDSPVIVNYKSPVNLTDSTSLTIPQLVSGLIIASPSTVATYTLPTGALMDSGLDCYKSGAAIEFSIINTSLNRASSITIAASSGFTINNGQIVLAGHTANFRARRIGSGTWILQRLQGENTKGTQRSRGTIATRQAYPFGTGATGANFTFLCELEAPAEFDAVRFVMLNGATGGTKSIGLAKAAVVDALGNNGSGLTWSSFTFNSSATATLSDAPTRVAGSTTTYAVPAATGTGATLQPGVCISDWLDLRSIARTDGGTKPLLQIRVYLPDAGTTGVAVTAAATDFDGKTGMKWRTAIGNGDGVTTPSGSNITATSSSTQWLAVTMVQFCCRGSIVQTATFGDSLDQGYGGATDTTGYYGYPAVAVDTLNAANTSVKFSAMNHSIAGQTTAQSYLWATSILPNSGLDFAVLHVWSPNDGSSAAQFDLDINYVTSFIALCKKHGIVPIIRTAIPDAIAMTSGAIDARRLTANATALSMLATNNGLLFDANSVVSDGATPQRMITGYAVPDGRHCSQTGYNALGANFAQLLTSQLVG